MFKKQSIRKVVLLHIATLGIYFFIWCRNSKNEVNQKLGRQVVPSAWLLLVPIANYVWAYTYSRALEDASKGSIKALNSFGLWIIAHVVFLFGFNFIFNPSVFTDDETLVAIIYLLEFASVIFAGIMVLAVFPALMQKEINKFIDSNKGQSSQSPVLPGPPTPPAPLFK